MNHWWALTILLAALGLVAGCGDDDTKDPGEACEAWCWFIHDDVLEVDDHAQERFCAAAQWASAASCYDCIRILEDGYTIEVDDPDAVCRVHFQ